MAKQLLNGVLQHLRKMAAVQSYRGLSDRELLESFTLGHDEAAFAVLMERHGPMVLGVCRRNLPGGNVHDAEDACQATFLVLARKAGSVCKKTSLASWLHGVACRVAANLKRSHARRKRHERETISFKETAPKDPAAEVTWREVQVILDEELQLLPERYRAPLILCYLECMTRDEAAQQLRLSPAALHGRLERARDLLRRHLTKRGLSLAAVMSAAALGDSIARASLQGLEPTFVVSSTKAALLLAAGQPLAQSAVATNVLALTQEVLKTMFLTKLKLCIGAVLCAGVCAVLIDGSFTAPSMAQDSKPLLATRVIASEKTEDDAKPANQDPLSGASAQKLDPSQKAESDLDFIRRISKDLRGIDPSPTEVHFFAESKDEGRRQKLVDLFIQERQSKKALEKLAARIERLILQQWTAKEDRVSDAEFMRRRWLDLTGKLPGPAEVDDFLKSKDPNKRPKLIQQLLEREDFVNRYWDHFFGIARARRSEPTGLGSLQKKFFKEIHTAADKGDVARFTQAYLDGLIDYVKTNPKSEDILDAMRQIIFVYESKDRTVEAGAWRDTLLQEYLKPSSKPASGPN